MNVCGADFVAYYVKNLDRSVEFYRDVLNLPLTIYRPDWNWAEFEVAPTTLALFGDYPGAPLNAGVRGGVGLGLAVSDVVSAVKELSERGVEIADGPHELSTCFIATICDPDGNPVFLHQRKDGTFG